MMWLWDIFHKSPNLQVDKDFGHKFTNSYWGQLVSLLDLSTSGNCWEEGAPGGTWKNLAVLMHGFK